MKTQNQKVRPQEKKEKKMRLHKALIQKKKKIIVPCFVDNTGSKTVNVRPFDVPLVTINSVYLRIKATVLKPSLLWFVSIIVTATKICAEENVNSG